MNGDAPASPPPSSVEFADLTRVTVFFGLAVATGMLFTVWYSVTFNGMRFGGVVMWALALFASGAGVGFLFGIPKVLQGERPAAPSAASPPAAGSLAPADSGPTTSLAYHQRVNTNLEEISDWLTKIIVGVSLIQLKSVPDYVRRLADLIGAILVGPQPERGFGVSLVLFYTTAGFLYGYLSTRLYIQGALARAERGIVQESLRAEQGLRSQSGKAVRQVEEALQRQVPPQGAPAPAAAPGVVDDALRRMADEYLNVHIEDWGLRVRRKDELAAEMGAHVINHQISRATLADETNEGLLLALATAAHTAPEREDTDRLINAARRVSRLHVQYRFILAFTRLLDHGYVTPGQRSAIRNILNTFETRADDSLRQAIAGLRRQLG